MALNRLAKLAVILGLAACTAAPQEDLTGRFGTRYLNVVRDNTVSTMCPRTMEYRGSYFATEDDKPVHIIACLLPEYKFEVLLVSYR